jgi:hypothetical protein
MTWFRENIRQGSRLALFALAVQLLLSFGHFHPLDLPGLRADATVVASSGDASSPQQPSHHGSDPADYCAICAVMALAGTVVVSTPPVLDVPQAFAFLYAATDAKFVHLDSARVAFQPRAPPVS